MASSTGALISRATYARTLRGVLPDETFARAPARLAFLPLYVAAAAIGAVAIARGWVPWFVVPVLSVAIGLAFAGMTFVTHELLHGAMIRSRTRQRVLGWIGFLPFALSPTLWCAWHNRAHHAHANMASDPDIYPTLEGYHASRGARFAVDAFSLGGKRWRGGLSLILGFTVQSANQLFSARGSGFLTAPQHRRAYSESALAVAVWAMVAVLVGIIPFLFVYVLPLLVANVCVMAFILTNHSLSPRVAIDDPLASGLTVTTPRLVRWLTLGFGYHVEHHIFPGMSTCHAPAVRAELLARWPERYQTMPLGEALARLHATARVYKDAATLFDPLTGRAHATL